MSATLSDETLLRAQIACQARVDDLTATIGTGDPADPVVIELTEYRDAYRAALDELRAYDRAQREAAR